LWPDVPFAASKKHTWYWKFQKHLIRSCSTVFCISNATCQDLNFIIKNARFKTPVIYMPATNNVVISPASRNPYFITFGGAPHKNLKRTIEAFSIIKKDFPDLKIVILGNIDAKEELPVTLPSGITFEDMSHYDTHKQNASGLISCSIHEGLGLPPIEAVQFGCPLLLSTIPCYKELWKETACFANPLDVNSIADGMKNLLANQDVWQKKALQGKIVYSEMARENQKKIVAAYK
jgi:glycosyltransferase involved in cell wall biosynthesis